MFVRRDQSFGVMKVEGAQTRWGKGQSFGVMKVERAQTRWAKDHGFNAAGRDPREGAASPVAGTSGTGRTTLHR